MSSKLWKCEIKVIFLDFAKSICRTQNYAFLKCHRERVYRLKKFNNLIYYMNNIILCKSLLQNGNKRRTIEL